jgi:hypothetical protein
MTTEANPTYTPGPWHIAGLGRTVRDLSGREICRICPNDGLLREALPNARLIAAAPELLEALRVLLDAVLRRDWKSFSEVVGTAQKAILKATGEDRRPRGVNQ